MTAAPALQLTPRVFTRREKTILRQDVKRFEKIGRDHGVTTFDDYAHFVIDRIKYDDDDKLTEKSFNLVRGLTAYYGEQLLYDTTLARLATDIAGDVLEHERFATWWKATPGLLLVDRFAGQSVMVASIIWDRIFPSDRWPMGLDELFDQIIDWNHGYLIQDEVDTQWVTGNDMKPEDYLAA